MTAATTRSDDTNLPRAGSRPVTHGRRADTALPTLLDVDGVAEVLGVGVRLVRRLVDERRIPFVKVGHYVRFDPREISRWIDERRVPECSSRRGLPR
jgi:excisionase family DNA binding protein